jgi:hypothetical protein
MASDEQPSTSAIGDEVRGWVEAAQVVTAARQEIASASAAQSAALMSAKVEEFDFHAIGSLAFSKKLGGESIDIATSGRSAAITQVAHGRAATFVAAFRRVHSGARTVNPALAPQTASAPDLADQIRKLSCATPGFSPTRSSTRRRRTSCHASDTLQRNAFRRFSS